MKTHPCQHLLITTVRPNNETPAVHICGECGERLTSAQARAEKVTRDDMNINLGQEICKALDINDKWITGIKLEMFPGCPPVLTLERVVMGAEHDALRGVLERYRVIPIASAPQADSQASTGSN